MAFLSGFLARPSPSAGPSGGGAASPASDAGWLLRHFPGASLGGDHGISPSSILTSPVVLVLLVPVVFLLTWTARDWARLRHVPGPRWAGVSKWWMLKHTVGGQMHVALKEVCDQYGELARVPSLFFSIFIFAAPARFVWLRVGSELGLASPWRCCRASLDAAQLAGRRTVGNLTPWPAFSHGAKRIRQSDGQAIYQAIPPKSPGAVGPRRHAVPCSLRQLCHLSPDRRARRIGDSLAGRRGAVSPAGSFVISCPV